MASFSNKSTRHFSVSFSPVATNRWFLPSKTLVSPNSKCEVVSNFCLDSQNSSSFSYNTEPTIHFYCFYLFQYALIWITCSCWRWTKEYHELLGEIQMKPLRQVFLKNTFNPPFEICHKGDVYLSFSVCFRCGHLSINNVIDSACATR